MALVLVVIQVLLSAYTMQSAWLWFVVPLGLQPLSMAHAFGLDRMVSWIVTTDIDAPLVMSHYIKEHMEEFGPHIRRVIAILFTAVTLGVLALARYTMTIGW